MSIDQLRLEAAESIRAKHRRVSDAAAPKRVTITPTAGQFDLVRIEYPDGMVREFQRLRPIEPIEEQGH